jgi:hypothetical protein
MGSQIRGGAEGRVLQRTGDLPLNLARKRQEITGPKMAATRARQRHHGVAFDDQRRAIMLTLRALNR